MDLKNIAEEIRQIITLKQSELGLQFFEEEHKYFMKDLDGNLKSDFPSVSKVLKCFYDEFPTEQAAYNKSGGNPEEQERLIKEWADAGDYATNMGSRVHYILEKKSIEMFGGYKEVRQPIFDCDILQIQKGDSMVKAGTDYLKLMEKRGAVLIDTEMVLGDPELGYVGQPDKMWLMENKNKTGFGLVISDWKTNKPKNFQKSLYTKKMKTPFHFVDDYALGHYYIQLPLYCKLLIKMLEGSKYEGIDLLGGVVILLKDDSEFVEYKIPKEVISTVMDMNVKNYLKLKK
jgi:hypothetical protein